MAGLLAIKSHLRLTGDAINASSGRDALSHAGTNCCKSDGKARANGTQGRDPHLSFWLT